MSPDKEIKIRQRLGEALITFAGQMRDNMEVQDDVMRQVHTASFRREVERAAQKGIEVSLAWQSLAIWTEEGKERIGYFSRAIVALDAEIKKSGMPKSCHELWCRGHLRAEALYEIGRIHAYEGEPAVAREFLEQARSLIFVVDTARAGCKEEGVHIQDDNLEGKIATLLVQLPADGETLDAAQLEPEE